MRHNILGQEARLDIFQTSPKTINSGDAVVGRYTGIRVSLFSSKYLSTFFDL